MKVIHKNAIALLITLLFIIAITASIGIGLKQVNKASKEIQKEKFMLQASSAIDDIMTILKNSPELDAIVKDKSPAALYAFILQSSFIPFESSGAKIILEIKSARAKFNPNLLKDVNKSLNEPLSLALREYFSRYNINTTFVDIMIDNMGGIKEDLVYNSDIFYEKPELFRDMIVSKQHFGEIKDFYKLTYHENSLKNINFDNLFYFSKDKTTKIDLNYASAEVWEFILGVDKVRARELTQGLLPYEKMQDIGLQTDEKLSLAKFNTSLFEPYIDVSIEVIEDDKSAIIKFEYDLVKKKGTNFSYDI